MDRRFYSAFLDGNPWQLQLASDLIKHWIRKGLAELHLCLPACAWLVRCQEFVGLPSPAAVQHSADFFAHIFQNRSRVQIPLNEQPLS